jgi:hypothetical protein
VADPRRKELIQLLADGTGLSEEEFKFYVATAAASALVAGAAVAYLGVVRLREFLREG